MKPPRQDTRRRVTRSMTRVHQNSSPIIIILPDDLIAEIFSCLPSKAIALCRCLSKHWASRLRRDDFTELFLTKSRARPHLLFCEYHDVFSSENKKIVLYSSPQLQNLDENSSYVVSTNHLARFPNSNCFFGCTNGFVCYRATSILICNPSTRQCLTLPGLNSEKESGYEESYLGYDPIAKQLKVLSMNRWLVNGECISVDHQVLTLGSTNELSWRLVECCIPHYYSCRWICINGVLYYPAAANSSSLTSMVACFDLSTEKFSFVNLMEPFSEAMDESETVVNYNGKLGLLMVRDFCYVSRESTSFELWVLQDAGKHEWSKHVYALPPSWKDVVTEGMRIAGMVGTNEIVLSPIFPKGPTYVIYYNVESKTITKVGVLGMEAFQGGYVRTYLNYVENVKLL